jgi:hypothetical protein
MLKVSLTFVVVIIGFTAIRLTRSLSPGIKRVARIHVKLQLNMQTITSAIARIFLGFLGAKGEKIIGVYFRNGV